MTYEYLKEYETGIELIDQEHRKFFDYINAGVEALDLPDEEGIALARNLLKKLSDYAEEHFSHEEEHMRQTHDAQLLIQMRFHQDFRDHLKTFPPSEKMTKKDLGNIFVFMAKWLKNHILSMDMLIGQRQNEKLFEMTDDFLTHIDIIDEQHRHLFDIIGRAYDIMEDEYAFDKYDSIVDILAELKDYTIFHFGEEEAYMEKIHYKGLAAQKLVHEAFIEKVSHLDLDDMSNIDEDQSTFLMELMNFLTDWLVQHILKMDKKIPTEE